MSRDSGYFLGLPLRRAGAVSAAIILTFRLTRLPAVTRTRLASARSAAWHDAAAVSDPSQSPSSVERRPAEHLPAERSFAGIRLAPGYLPRHALIYLYAAFVTVGLFAFVSFFQAYLLNVNLRLPAEVQGRTVAGLLVANELVALGLVAPFGALADKIGRRAVYAFGLLWVAASFLIYPLAATPLQLTCCSMFYSVGAAAIGTMLGTVLADTPAEDSRGKLVGLAGFCQGLGAATLVLVLGHVPKWLHDAGMDDQRAGAMALWLAAALCVLSAVVVYAGLKRGTPSTSAAVV